MYLFNKTSKYARKYWQRLIIDLILKERDMIIQKHSILYDHGINTSDEFGVAIDENECRRLMSNAESIVGEIMNLYWHPIQGYMGLVWVRFDRREKIKN